MKISKHVNFERLNNPFDMFDNTINYPIEDISSCAIIGNSGKVLNNEYGSYIDSHDCVIRLNTAPIRGWERFIGSKNTFRFVNGMLMKGVDFDYLETEINWLSTIKNERLIFGRTTLGGIEKGIYQTVNANDIHFMSKTALDFIHHFEKAHEFNHMSMGLLASLFFLKIADVVNLFGFGFNTEGLENKHYWETFSSDHDGGHHWEREKEITLSLHKRGYINIIDL